MSKYTYVCKKAGLNLAYEFDSESAPVVSNDYAWRRGVREYMDNYHASLTAKGYPGKKGATIPWADVAEWRKNIEAHCDEAARRFMAGDVPGERVPADPAVAARAKAMESAVAASGVDTSKLDPAKLLAVLTAALKKAAA